MGAEFNDKLMLSIFSALFALFVGVLVGEPLRRAWSHWLDTHEKIRELLRPRFKFNIIQLCDPDLPAFDFGGRLKDQTKCQKRFEFALERLRAPSRMEVDGLKGTRSKREFVDKVERYLAEARATSWMGLVDKPPSKRFKGSRDLVITNIPLPGNFYGWNSMDRALLVISTAPSQYVLPTGGTLTVEQFVIRIAQRMAVFATAPSINPRRDHVRKSVGCLFDFTLALSSVRDILETCLICTDCCRLIARDRGAEFALHVRNWVEDQPLLPN